MRILKVFKNIWSQLYRFVLWAVLLSVFWVWIYSMVGDPPKERKVVVYISAYDVNDRELSLRLEEEGLPEGIKMIQARGFDYVYFGNTLEGDVYIIKESLLQTNLEDETVRLAPISLPEGSRGYTWNGSCYGILVFDPETQRGPAMRDILYANYPEPEPEPYYLCFDVNTVHLESNPGAVDNAAWEVAMRLLALGD